jgi:hypothetical protein
MTSPPHVFADASKPQIPTAARLEEIEAGIVTPTPFERDYISRMAASSKVAEAQPGSGSKSASIEALKEPVLSREQIINGTPWYNPDVKTLEGARRAIMPGIWVMSAITVLQLLVLFTDNLFPGQEMGGLSVAFVFAIVVGWMGLLLLFAYQGARIALTLLALDGLKAVWRGAVMAYEGDLGIGISVTVTGIAMTAILFVGLFAATRYHKEKQSQTSKILS